MRHSSKSVRGAGRHGPDTESRRADTWIAIVIAVAVLILTAATIEDPGLTWDEGNNIVSAYHHLEWLSNLTWDSFSKESVEASWRADTTHPPLAKVMAGALCKRFGDTVGSFRLFSACCFALLVAVVFGFVSRHFGRRAGLLSAVSLVVMPRLFAHAHIGALDMPIALMWFATVAAFAKGIESHRWSILTGVLFGLALLTKIHAVLIPVPLLVWGLIFYRRAMWRNFIWMIIIGPILFVGGWPWLWHDTFRKVYWYLASKSGGKRMIVETYYLGRAYTYRYPPGSYPLVMTAVTVPVGILLAAIGGLACPTEKGNLRQQSEKWLIIINAIAILFIAMMPGVPRYDGVRLFLAAFPFIACLAGVGLDWAWQGISEAVGRKKQWLPAVAVTLLLVMQAVPVIVSNPYGMNYYNILIGGVSGARKMGMESTYWGDALDRSVLDFLNRTCPKNATVAFFPVGASVPPISREIGWLNEDIKIVSFPDDPADFLVLVARQGKFTGEARRLYENGTPVFTSYFDVGWLGLPRARSGEGPPESPRDVPLCLVYDLR